MEIAYLDCERRHYAACPVLPEFSFSPRKHGLTEVPQKPEQAPAVYGPPIPPGVLKPTRSLTQRVVSSAEEAWLKMETIFSAPVLDHTKPPVGTAPTLEGLGRFLSRVDELNALIRTQFLELPTVGQELAQTGLSAVSSSYSDDSDDDSAFDVDEAMRERHACRYGTAYLTADLAPIVRRIEWERYIYHCGPVQRVVIVNRDGQVSAQSIGKLPDELVAQMGNKLYKAMGKPPIAEVVNDRERVAHYGVVGSVLYGVLTGEHTPEQSMDDLADPADPPKDGPKELRFHEVDEEEQLDVNEPPESILWPVTMEEVYWNLTHNFQLSQMEWAWLDRNPEAYESLRSAGLVS